MGVVSSSGGHDIAIKGNVEGIEWIDWEIKITFHCEEKSILGSHKHLDILFGSFDKS